MKRIKQLITIFLAMVIAAGMLVPEIPTVEGATSTIPVDSWETLKSALELDTKDPVVVQLSKDIVKTIDYKDYRSFISEGYENPQITVKGKKTLVLGLYTIRCNDNSNVYLIDGNVQNMSMYWAVNHGCINRSLFNIPAGAELEVTSVGTFGGIFYDAYMVKPIASWRTDGVSGPYAMVVKRDIFDVSGTLTICDGLIAAGRSKQQYNPHGVMGSDTFMGNAYQQIWGTAVNVRSGGNFTMSGGWLEGRGQGNGYFYSDNRDGVYRDEVVFVAAGGKATINDGNFIARGGANIFSGNGVKTGLTVKYGSFETKTVDYIRCVDTMIDNKAVSPIIKGTMGKVGIPDSAWISNMKDILITGESMGVSGIPRIWFCNTDYRKKEIDVENFSGTLKFVPAEEESSLAFGEQSPRMPDGQTETTIYLEQGKTATFTFNNRPLGEDITEFWGYSVEKEYVLRYGRSLKKTGSSNDSGALSFEYSFNNPGTYMLYENIIMKNASGVEEENIEHVFEIVVEPLLQSIQVKTPPAKTVYAIGSTFDPTGMEVIATYSDGSTKDVTEFVEVDDGLLLGAGEVVLTYTENRISEITVSTTQSISYDEKISTVSVSGIDLPIAGEKPDYYGCLGDGNLYQFAQYGAKLTGICWNTGEGAAMDPDETFETGKTYQLEIKLQQKTYEGKTYTSFQNPVKAYVNGEEAENVFANTQNVWIYVDYVCKGAWNGAEITSVEVMDIDTPVGGNMPDYQGTVGIPEAYQFAKYGFDNAGFFWYDEEGGLVGPTDKFVAGKTYTLEIKLEQMLGSVATTFKPPVTAKLNGEDVDPVNVMSSAKNVYIYAAFVCETGPYLVGDTDQDDDVDIDDAIYLLQYVLMPEMFPVSQPADFNKSDVVDIDDAIYLLQHVLMPEMFPL